MGLVQITPPSVEPVLLAEAKAFLRVDIPDDDALISSFITGARVYIERYLERQLVTSTWKISYDTFPLYTGTQFPWPFLQQVPTVGAYQLGTYYMQTPSLGILMPNDPGRQAIPNIGNIALPLPNLQSVTSIQYLDQTNTLQTWNASNYQVVSSATPGYIKPSAAFPAIASNVAEAVRITFVAGYSDDGTYVPEPIKIAIKLLLASWYETRQPSAVAEGIEQAVHALIQSYKFEVNR